MTITSKRRQRGLSLIELMIAMVIGLMVVAAAGSIFLVSSRNYRQDERLTAMRDELNYALAVMAQDAEMGGFWATLLNSSSVILDSPSLNDPGCGPAAVPGWAYTNLDAFSGVDNATGATANAEFPCIASTEVAPSTDVIAIKRVAGLTWPGIPIAGDGVFLRSNGTTGTLYLGGANPVTPVPAPVADWQYRPAIYYVRNYSVTEGDGIPSLCRKVLEENPPVFQSEDAGCLAEGIEDMQIEYGIDNDTNGAPDIFVPAPTAAQFQLVSAVRISLLGRSAQAMPGYTNAKTYRLGNAPVRTPDDRFYRRVASITVAVRNPASLRVLLGTGTIAPPTQSAPPSP